MDHGPAYRVETQRLVLRCYEPSDHRAVDEVIGANLERFAAWMPWLKGEPLSADARIERLRTRRAAFDLGGDFVYAMFDSGGAFVGSTSLHPRVGPRATEIGYWIAGTHEGHGLVTEAAGALTRVALEIHGLERVEIHCDPLNPRSAAVPRRLGYAHDGTLRRRSESAEGAPRDLMTWSIFSDELAASPASQISYVARDGAGRTLGRRP